MSETESTVVSEDDGKLLSLNSQVAEKVESSARVACSDKEVHESRKMDEMQLKEQELPEPIRHKDKNKEMVPCLPSINLSELATILRDPNMPSQKIMKEVADKMMLKSEESESDDGSVSSSGGVGMKGLLDCIFEVSYMHEDSASSEDDEDSFERIPREIPCNFCNKIFGSTMTWNTHVLVAHSHQDSSVLNMRRMSTHEADRKDRSHHRKHHRGSSRADSDAKDTKVCHTLTDSKHTTGLSHGEENVPVRKRRSSFTRSQQKEIFTGKSDQKYQSPIYQVERESLPKERRIDHSAPSCDIINLEMDKLDSQNETSQNEVHVYTDQLLSETGSVTEKECMVSLPIEHENEGTEHTLSSDKSSQNRKDDTEKQVTSGATEEDGFSSNPSNNSANLGKGVHSGRKRKTSLLQEPTSSLHVSSSSNPKRSKNVATNPVSTSQHKQS